MVAFRRYAAWMLLASSLAVSLTACDPLSRRGGASVKTTDVHNTSVKWQSIGNCWVYAVTGWVESMVMNASSGGEKPDFSETYLQYRHYEEQLLKGDGSAVATGGTWGDGADLILKHGLMAERDFIPSEAGKAMSEVQKSATELINESLASGALSRSRDAATVRAELDRAFGVHLADLESKIVSADKLMVRATKTGETRSLALEIDQWDLLFVAFDYAHLPQVKVPEGPVALGDDAKKDIRVLKRALNAGAPVIMSWYVDFSALDEKGILSLANLKKAMQESGKTGRQGDHLTVLEDYVASGTDPRTGRRFRTPEGEISKGSLKELAAEVGDLEYLIVKNSWGGAERTDRPSYRVGGEAGFHRIEADYLWGLVPVGSAGEPTGSSRMGSYYFVVPKSFLAAR